MCLARVPSVPITPGPSSSPDPCRSSSPLPPQAAQVPGRQREGAPWSALGSHQGNDTGVRQEGKFPGWRPSPPPTECWTANAPRPHSPSFLSAAKPPSGCKTLEPVPTPSAHQPCGSLPAPHHDWLSVRAGECASGRRIVPGSCAPSVACPADAGACAGPGPPLLGRVRRINYLS